MLLHKAFGLNNLFTQLLNKQRPRKVVFTNDHIPEARSYIFACQKLGIETIYIQHGSVSKYFPPLEFNLALLESKYSKEMYSKSENINTKIRLVGIPKLDNEIKQIRERNQIKKIGIAINQNDNFQKVKQLLQFLIDKNYEVILRKHPSDIRKFDLNNHCQDGNVITVFDFIRISDFIIASDSSIHVESNSLKCRSVYFKLHENDNKYDYYGYLRNGFIDEANSLGELEKYLINFDYKFFDFGSSKLGYYNSSIGTSNFGRSSTQVKTEIFKTSS